MKKTSTYILSVVIIVVLAISIIIPGIGMLKHFAAGFSDGYNDAKTEMASNVENTVPVDINFKPTLRQAIETHDSIAFDNGEQFPLVISKATVNVPNDRMPAGPTWISSLCYLLSYVVLLVLIYKFFRFIINISKEKIFSLENIRLLKQFSWCLLIIAGLEIIAGFIEDYVCDALHLTLEGYALSGSWNFPTTTLLIGLVSMLLALVWEHGLKIQEDQDLTI